MAQSQPSNDLFAPPSADELKQAALFAPPTDQELGKKPEKYGPPEPSFWENEKNEAQGMKNKVLGYLGMNGGPDPSVIDPWHQPSASLRDEMQNHYAPFSEVDAKTPIPIALPMEEVAPISRALMSGKYMDPFTKKLVPNGTSAAEAAKAVTAAEEVSAVEPGVKEALTRLGQPAGVFKSAGSNPSGLRSMVDVAQKIGKPLGKAVVGGGALSALGVHVPAKEAALAAYIAAQDIPDSVKSAALSVSPTAQMVNNLIQSPQGQEQSSPMARRLTSSK